MAPTMEVESTPLPSVDSVRTNSFGQGSTCNFADPTASIKGVAKSSETCLECKTVLQNSKSVIPEASSVFKEALNKLKLEKAQDNCKKDNAENENNTPSPQPVTANQPSFLTKLKSAFKSTPAGSPHPPLCRSEGLPSKSSAPMKPVRRPASFGGSDGVKLSAGRRASQFEKRVSWADEYGSNHPLFSVRLIKPRLSTDNSQAGQSAPGHSILRNTGIC